MFQREEIEAICAYLFCQLLQSKCIANFRRAVDNLLLIWQDKICVIYSVIYIAHVVFKGSVAVLEARAVFLMAFQVYESYH